MNNEQLRAQIIQQRRPSLLTVSAGAGLIDENLEPVDAREREDQDLADFDVGFQSRLDELPRDEFKSAAWLRGWDSAHQD